MSVLMKIIFKNSEHIKLYKPKEGLAGTIPASPREFYGRALKFKL